MQKTKTHLDSDNSRALNGIKYNNDENLEMGSDWGKYLFINTL